MDIVRKELTPDELQNPNNRYNPDCDCTQTTIDGGATWQNNPSVDPRTSAALLLPVPSTSDPRCDAATGIVANFHDGLTQVLQNLNTTGNAFAGASVILTILDFLDGIGLIIQLFIDFCALILSIGVELVEADFTDSVYAQFACNLYCDAKPDGSWDAASFDQLLADNATSFGETSTVNLILSSWLNGLGWVGLSNVGSVKRTTGDCSDCECGWCFTIDFTLTDGGFAAAAWGGSAAAAWESGVGWHDNGGFGSAKGVWIQYAASESINYISADVFYSQNGQLDNVSTQGFVDPATSPTWSFNVHGIPDTGNTSLECEPTQYLQLALVNDSSSLGSGAITKVILRGIGDNPFGESNC